MIEVKFRKTLADYTESQRSHVRKTLCFRLYMVLAVGTALAAAYKVIFIDVMQGFLLALLSAFWLLPSFLFSLRIQRNFRKQSILSCDYVIRADENGIEIASELTHGSSKWAVYTGFRETRNLFLIFTQGGSLISIPKRAFSPGLSDQFRKLLVQKLPNK